MPAANDHFDLRLCEQTVIATYQDVSSRQLGLELGCVYWPERVRRLTPASEINVIDLAAHRIKRAVRGQSRRSPPRYVLWYPGVGYVVRNEGEQAVPRLTYRDPQL